MAGVGRNVRGLVVLATLALALRPLAQPGADALGTVELRSVKAPAGDRAQPRRGRRPSRGAPTSGTSSSRTTRGTSTTTPIISSRTCRREYHFDERWLDGQWIVGLCSVPELVRPVLAIPVRRAAVAAHPGSPAVLRQAVRGRAARVYEANTRTRFRSTSGRCTGHHARPSATAGCATAREFVLLGANAAMFTVGMTMP